MENEAVIRLSLFLGLFALFALLEAALPRRSVPRSNRWVTNWVLVAINTFALRVMAVLVPLLAVGAAMTAENAGWGLFNRLALPLWLEIVLTVMILDFAVWAHHVLNHKIPLFWRIHRVHHADEHIDVTTAIRFHPFESLISMLLKIGVVFALGPAAVAVVIFEIVLNGSAMFNHANIKLPLWLDRWLRLVWVTPDMHRIHHSVERREHDSNYGFALSIWDRMFGTYIQDPEDGHEDMQIGLRWRNKESERLGWSLILPFRKL